MNSKQKAKVPVAPMRQSWLVQRLNRPIGQSGFDNPFSFGGGMVNGGLSPDAMGMLRPIFSFDYMGSAEFEFGAVPKALQAIGAADLTAGSLTVWLADVPAGWRAPNDAPAPEGGADIYFLCQTGHEVEVRARIFGWATGKERLKERTNLPAALRPVEEWDSRTAGWLELDNGFMFFTDKAMWSSVCRLFGVTA